MQTGFYNPEAKKCVNCRRMKAIPDSIGKHSIPFDRSPSNWIFTDKSGVRASVTDQEQIALLSAADAAMLWEHEMRMQVQCSEKYFNTCTTYESRALEWQASKKFIFDLGIPMERKVFVSASQETGFMLTWKMLIRYSHRIFTASDKAVWDGTLNWKLEYRHPGRFVFGKDFSETH